MNSLEPPSPQRAATSALFLIGRDSRGHWVVQDQRGLYGGLFVDRSEALRYAMFENGNRPQAVIMVPGIIELDINGPTKAAVDPPAGKTGAPAAA
jgi:hypothetical protein